MPVGTEGVGQACQWHRLITGGAVLFEAHVCGSKIARFLLDSVAQSPCKRDEPAGGALRQGLHTHPHGKRHVESFKIKGQSQFKSSKPARLTADR